MAIIPRIRTQCRRSRVPWAGLSVAKANLITLKWKPSRILQANTEPARTTEHDHIFKREGEGGSEIAQQRVEKKKKRYKVLCIQHDFRLTTLLTQAPKLWDHRRTPPHTISHVGLWSTKVLILMKCSFCFYLLLMLLVSCIKISC